MDSLIKFQTDRGLDKKDFDIITETANIIEEILEASGLDIPKENRPKLKDAIGNFIATVVVSGIAKPVHLIDEVPEHEQVDAFADIITFATGAILKLGHDPKIAIAECGKEINSRVGTMVDGKFEKDLSDEAKANWYQADYSKSKLS